MHSGEEADAFGAELVDAALDDVFLHFEVGDAVDEQAAETVGLFVDGDGVADAPKLLRGCETSWTGTDDGDSFAGFECGWLGDDPAFGESAVGDGFFDLFDGHRRLIDAEDAGGFARSGADAAGEFREIVGGVESADGFFPAGFVDELVPVGDDVVDWTAGVAERHAAVHTARTLLLELFVGEIAVDFEPVVDAFGDGAALG